MAKFKNEINDTAQEISDMLDNLYIDTHATNPTNKLDLIGIQLKADEVLDKISKNNFEHTGKRAYSQISARLNTNKGTNTSYGESITKDLTNDEIKSLLSLDEQRTLEEYDKEIDIICKYMPILDEAIKAKMDNVLCADQFTEDFLIMSNKSVTNIDTTNDYNRLQSMKDNYNLVDRSEDIYLDISKYGEYFLYVAPYSEEVSNILETRKNKMGVVNPSAVAESYNDIKKIHGIVHEGFKINHEIIDENGKNINTDTFTNVTINYSGLIDTFVTENDAIKDSLEMQSGIYGILDETKKEIPIKDQISSIPGAIVKKLDRSKILPIYINNEYCYGYYYFEGKKSNINDINRYNYMAANIGNNRPNNSPQSTAKNKETFLKELSKSIADRITPKFLLDNQDLKYELYNILKLAYQDGDDLNITYIPPHYVEHFYWRKDPVTNRGISELDDSLVPAKMYIGLYIGNVVGILTRGFDRRVYYVKSSIDTNLSQNLLSAVNIIKAGNRGLRSFATAPEMLGSIGRFHDLLITTDKNGQSPIDFSIMEGQNIDTKEALMEQLEFMAVSPIGTPYEYLISRKSVDYAIRLTMSSGKFLKDCFKRQSLYAKMLSRAFTKIYNYEFNNNDLIDVKLPPPTYLSTLNAIQMTDTVKNQIDSTLDLVLTEELEEGEMKHVRRLLAEEKLSGYIDFNNIDSLVKEAKIKELQPGGKGQEESEEE